MNVHWEPNPGPQTEVLKRSEDEILYGGARGGGKTDAGIVWMVEPDYISNQEYRGLVIRKNSDDLSDWIARARLMYQPLNCEVVGNPPIIRFKSGAFIRTGHLKDDTAYEKYQGHEYQKMLIEELTQIPTEDRYLKLIASCRSTVVGLKAQVFCTANPGGSGHGWVKSRFVDIAKYKTYMFSGNINGKKVVKSRIFVPARIEDTPQLIENDPSYILFLESLPADLRRAWREGDWTVFAGQFFSDWRDAVHTIQPFFIPDSWDKIFSLDWGFDPHPLHCGWYAISPDHHVYKYREFQATEMSPFNIGMKIYELSKNDKNLLFGVGDTQMWQDNPFAKQKDDQYANPEQSIAVQINSCIAAIDNLHMRQANKSRVNGWVNLKSLMQWKGDFTVDGLKFAKEPRFHVFSNCVKTIEAYPKMIHDEGKPGDMKKLDGDDPCDTDRYAIMGMIGDSILPDVFLENDYIQFNKKTIWDKGFEERDDDLLFPERTKNDLDIEELY